MEANSTEQLLIEMVSEASGVPVESISTASSFEQLGMDSLEFMELIADVSAKFKSIPKSRIFALDTVGDVLKEIA